MSEGNKVRVRPRTIDDVLVNPHIGFTTFQRFNGDQMNEGRKWTEGFPIDYQDFTGSLKVEGHPATSVAYFRIYWRFIEPKDGEYNWELIDKALETARQRKQTLMLRIAPYGTTEGTDVPDWYRAMVGEGGEFPHDFWKVDHNDPRYPQYFCRMIRALGERYDTNPNLDSVDLSIISAWGEGAESRSLNQDVREALVDAYVDSFKQTPLMMLLTDEATNKYGLARANVGYRFDCLGDMGGCWEGQGDWSHMLDHYPHQIIKSGMQDAWKKAPISFEVCWVMQHWLNQYWDVDYIIDQSLKWHISTFNAKSSAVPKEWEPNVDRWLKKMGYRFALRNISYSGVVKPGDELEYSMWWENLGVAPSYRPYPLALRIKNDRISQEISIDADIRDWLPGDILLEKSVTVPRELPQGNYQLQVAILDKARKDPIIQLANEGKQADGWYQIGNIKVGE